MAKLDLEWLGVFIEIYRTGKVSAAAHRLSIAQPAASAALGKLRAHFGDRLFTRTGRGMEPTPKAVAIYPHIVEAMSRIDLARGARSVFVPGESERGFRICMTDISEIVLLPHLMNHLRTVAPRSSIVAETITPDSARRLSSGEVDLVIGFTPALDAGFYQQALFGQDFVCLAAVDHPRIGQSLTRRSFETEDHIVVTAAGTGHAIVDKALARQRIRRHVMLRIPSFNGVSRIVAQTELLAIVPRLLGRALAAQEDIRLLESPILLPSYKVRQHWHARFHADAANIWLRRQISELFSGLGDTAGEGSANRRLSGRVARRVPGPHKR